MSFVWAFSSASSFTSLSSWSCGVRRWRSREEEGMVEVEEDEDDDDEGSDGVFRGIIVLF